MSDAMMDAEPMSYEDARRDLGQHGGARREHVIAREADRLRAELDDLERRRAKTPGEGMYLRDKLQIQAAEIDRLRAERDRLAERAGEVVEIARLALTQACPKCGKALVFRNSDALNWRCCDYDGCGWVSTKEKLLAAIAAEPEQP